MHSPGKPAIEVDAAVAEHLEVLDLVTIRRRRIVEAVKHARAFDRTLRRAIDDTWLGNSDRFEDRRHDINHVVPLAA